jgi:hypothetical protein
VVLQEGHRPRGPPAHHSGGLALRVDQPPVLVVQGGVQDALQTVGRTHAGTMRIRDSYIGAAFKDEVPRHRVSFSS